MRSVLVAGLLVLPATTQAEVTRNIELTVFDPTPTTSGSSFQVQTADVGASGEYVASAIASYASNPLVLETRQNDDSVVRHRTMVTVGGAYAFGNRFEAGARLPLYLQSGDPAAPMEFFVPPASGAAVGDLTLHGKVQLMKNEKLTLGAGLGVRLPIATDDQFAGTAMPSARLLGLMSYVVSQHLTINVNAGGVIRKKVEYANIDQGNAITWGIGAAYRMTDPLFIDVEVFGDMVPNGFEGEPAEGEMTGPISHLFTIEALAGVRYQMTRQMSLGAAVGRGLTAAFGSPDLRGVLTFAYAPIAPARAALIRPKKILKVEPGHDASKDDTDFDRLNDAIDKCPEYPEDKDGFEDEDGCPETDNDKDGIADAADKCPLVIEDKDEFEDSDGCPERDNDKDGIADAADKCPVKPEKINGNDDNDGCPDNGDPLVISHPDRLELMDSITFTGSAVSKTSTDLLGQLAATLRARADILRIRITVHVQPTKHPNRDVALSTTRANALREWLVKWGMSADRIEVKGFGGAKPLVPAKQKGSAEVNDRVELIILERN